MAVIETWLHQDLQEPVKVNHLDGNLFSNNGNGNRIGVVLTNNGEDLASISGTVSGYVVTADGSTVPCTGSKSGNRASILIPAAAYQPGSIFITVFITDGTTVTTVAAVSTTVMRSRTNAQVDPGSVVTDWTQTINAAMQSVETAAANLGGIVAVPYASITFPVPLGKYTYYNNNLYRCVTPIASSESFTAAHWIQVRLGDDVSDLKSALSDTIDRVFAKEDITYTLADIPDVTKRVTSNGTCNSSAVTIEDNADYDTYWFIADKTCDIYANQNGNNYYAMIRMNNFSGWTTHSTYIDGTGTDGVRYRNTEGNLPTSANPLTINAGTLISITVPKNTTAGLTFKNQSSNTLLNNSVVLNSAQIAQVKNKTMLLQYVSGSGIDSSTEQLYVYYPMPDGYIRYSFIHCVSSGQNCDIWRMSHAYKCSDNLAEDVQITTNGEWECAVQIQGRPDFSGGYIHGDEMIQAIDWFIDGKNVSSFADYATPQAISSLECIQYSNLYDPNDHETVVAKHGSIHAFNAENNGGLTIKQSVQWLGSYTLSNSYLAMFPVLKTVCDSLITDKYWTPTTITLDYTQSDVREAIVYKAGGGIKSVFSSPNKLDYAGSGTLLITDNGGLAYNKMYYFACQSGATVSNGTLWQTVTNYNITAG